MKETKTAEVKVSKSPQKTCTPPASRHLSLQALLQPLQLEKALTLAAKTKVKAKHFAKGDLLYHRILGTEAFQQVPMMMEKETAKEKTKTETKGKEDYSHHGGSLGKWTRRLESGTGTKIHIGMQTHTGIGTRISTGKTIKNLEYIAIIPTIEVDIEGQDLELILSYHVEKGQLVAFVNFYVPEIKDWLKPFI